MPPSAGIARGVTGGYCGLAAALLLTLSAIRYDKAIVGLCLAFCALRWRDGVAVFRRRRGLIVATLALLAWIAGLTWFRDDRISYVLFYQYAAFALCFLAALVALERLDDAAPAARIMLLFSLLPVIFVFIPEPVMQAEYFRVLHPFALQHGRWTSIFNNANNYGIAMAAGIGLAASLWLEGVIGTTMLLAACAIFGGQIYLSGSRNAVATAAIILLLAALALLIRERPGAFTRVRAAAIAAVGAAALMLAAAVTAVYIAPDNPWGRSFAVPLGIRQIAWTQFPQLVLERPFAGTSAARFLVGGPVAHGHNLPLTLAVEWGLVGLALCLAWAWQFYRASAWTMARLVAVAPFVAGQMVDDFHYFRPFGLGAAMVAAWCVAAPPGRAAKDRPSSRT